MLKLPVKLLRQIFSQKVFISSSSIIVLSYYDNRKGKKLYLTEIKSPEV